jgi:hypothetical protein
MRYWLLRDNFRPPVACGHSQVTDTFWYVTGIPELMAIASDRFERFNQGGSHA